MTPESPLRYTHTAPPGPGEALAVADGVYWVRMPLPFALDHINLWLLQDGVGWAIVDCGYGNDTTRELWARVLEASVGRGSVSRVIATHHHPDHVGNAGWLTQRFGATLWMTQAEYLTAHAGIAGIAGFGREPMVAMYRRNGLDDERAQKLRVGGNPYARVVEGFPTSYRRILDGEDIAIDGRAWRVITGYGHAPEHAALYCEELGVLISGDMVLPRISTNVSVPASQPSANPLRLFLDSLGRYEHLPPDTLVLPSHGMPFRGVRERIEQLRRHHELRLAELAEVCTTPKSAGEVLGTLFRRTLDLHQTLFAMGEAMAHLHYLHDAGTLVRLDGDVIRYVRR